MPYAGITIKAAMTKISRNEIYLPSIQRKFVWAKEDIVLFLDSIMRGYPIGTFLWWSILNDRANDYTFYKFITHYHERDNCNNEIAAVPHLQDIIGILDGQQRLASLYVALQGTYAYRRKGARRTDDTAYPVRNLYINLLYRRTDESDSDIMYEFNFLKSDDVLVDENHCWFPVRNVLTWPDAGSVFTALNDLGNANPGIQEALASFGGPTLQLLFNKLSMEPIINYFLVEEQDLDEIVPIFVRVNNAGKDLTQTDLLFASIIARWEQGREEIEALLRELNGRGNGFSFNNDFIMRCCLVLTDLPVLFKVKSFNSDNIQKIEPAWPRIRESLEVTVDLLVQWGFSGDTLFSLNAIIPIAYYIYKEGDIERTKVEWRKYLVKSLISQIFNNKTDRVLSAYRDFLREPYVEDEITMYRLQNIQITISALENVALPGDKNLRVSEEDIEQILNFEKGPYSRLILTMLYPNLRYDQVEFHQDHIHPRSKFNRQKYNELGLSVEEETLWNNLKDRLPNLQMMEGRENQEKRDSAFQDWLEGNYPDAHSKDHFLISNHIPYGISLEFSDFINFHDTRREILKNKIREVID